MEKKIRRNSKTGPYEFGRLLHMAAKRLHLAVQRSLNRAGLQMTLPQWQTLSVLAHADEVSQSALSNHMDKDRANVTRILDSLEHAGLVERDAHENDKRRYTVRITAAGRELESEARALAAEAEQKMLRGVPTVERRQFLRLLRRLADNLD